MFDRGRLYFGNGRLNYWHRAPCTGASNRVYKQIYVNLINERIISDENTVISCFGRFAQVPCISQ